MAERCADPRGGGQRSGDARHHLDVDRLPGGWSIGGGLCLEDGRGHGEHAGIARRHHRDASPGTGQLERVAGAAELGAVVRAVQRRGGAQLRRHHVQIGLVADEIGRPGENLARLRQQPAGIAGAEADDRQPPRRCRKSGTGHRRLAAALGMTTIEK